LLLGSCTPDQPAASRAVPLPASRAGRKSQILSVRRQQRAVSADPASRDVPRSHVLRCDPLVKGLLDSQEHLRCIPGVSWLCFLPLHPCELEKGLQPGLGMATSWSEKRARALLASGVSSPALT